MEKKKRRVSNFASICASGTAVPPKYARLSVREIVLRLRKLKVSIIGVKEKRDLIAKLLEAEKQQEKRKAKEISIKGHFFFSPLLFAKFGFQITS